MSKSPIPKLVARSGADHHALMLLAAINGRTTPEAMTPYLAAARAILRSPHAFDEGCEMLDQTVLHGGLHGWSPELGKLLHDILEPEADDQPVTSTTGDLRSVIFALVTETRLYGAAVMYELLNDGGVRR